MFFIVPLAIAGLGIVAVISKFWYLAIPAYLLVIAFFHYNDKTTYEKWEKEREILYKSKGLDFNNIGNHKNKK
jgi:hypothetical protein